MMNNVSYNVTGVMNSTIKNNLKNSLEKIEGIQDISIDKGRSMIMVNFNEPANEKDIRECVEKTCDIVSM